MKIEEEEYEAEAEVLEVQLVVFDVDDNEVLDAGRSTDADTQKTAEWRSMRRERPGAQPRRWREEEGNCMMRTHSSSVVAEEGSTGSGREEEGTEDDSDA